MKSNNGNLISQSTSRVGKVRSGRGRGAIFIGSLEPGDPILKMLGHQPFPGTLYIELKRPVNLSGLLYNQSNAIKTIVVPCEFQGKLLVAKWTNCFPQNLQLISEVNLRKTFSLTDGREYSVNLNLENIKSNNFRIFYSYFRLRFQNFFAEIR